MLNQQIIMQKSLGQSKSGIPQVKVQESSHNMTVTDSQYYRHLISQYNRTEVTMMGIHKLHSKHYLQSEDRNLKH